MVIETKNREKVRNKSVLLFSGGMDSLCCNFLYEPNILLHINYGGRYCSIEKEVIKRLGSIKAIDKSKVREIDIGNWLGKKERDDLIIPNRNIYFILLASEYGEEIMLGSIKGDRSFDKDNLFFKQMENLLNHVWDEQHWTEKRIFKIYSPIKHLTKIELVKKFLEKGGNLEWLLESYSCYNGDVKPCGLCKPCFRKAVALHANNISIPKNYFQNSPKENREINLLKQKIMRKEYRGEEDKYICEYMGWK